MGSPASSPVIRLFLPDPPSANVYWRHFRGRMVKSAAAHQFIKAVRLLALAAKVRPISGDVQLTAIWYRKRRVGDLDNRVKILCDALNGVAFQDDKQIRRLSLERVDGVRPSGIHVMIQEYT